MKGRKNEEYLELISYDEIYGKIDLLEEFKKCFQWHIDNPDKTYFYQLDHYWFGSWLENSREYKNQGLSKWGILFALMNNKEKIYQVFRIDGLFIKIERNSLGSINFHETYSDRSRYKIIDSRSNKHYWRAISERQQQLCFGC